MEYTQIIDKKNMLRTVFFLIGIFLLMSFVQLNDSRKYVLIRVVTKQIPGFTKKVKVSEVNKSGINQLNEPLRALAAYYSALAGSDCDGINCELTSALNLGRQGSNEHKALIKKWFPNDTVAKLLVDQDCFQSPSGASYFTNYKSLIFVVNRDTVDVYFDIIKYDYGKSYIQVNYNKAIIKRKEILIIKR